MQESIQERRDKYQTMITNFYDLVTDFYEYGWGQSFHFGPRWKVRLAFRAAFRRMNELT